MHATENEIQRWRRLMRRTSSLSRQELDELEDHVRTHADALVGAGAVGRGPAFAMASDDLGQPAELSREFAKVGAGRVRSVLVTAWILFAASFFLPVLADDPGYLAFVAALQHGGIVGQISALTNALMLVSVATLFTARIRWFPWVLAVAAALNLGYWPITILAEGGSPTELQIGYWAWAVSFACVAAAQWRRRALDGAIGDRSTEDAMLEA